MTEFLHVARTMVLRL